ncbi:protein takeout-like [Rhynchophorus ferrugineus]|uniref:Uncharacterized protein n=1 Tax=Rhynchophorus ferrugineus TaxID=354439 RepID=A0A834IS59_RHYFE|nr:hypothetical protein GWI33_010513 [Rhynchophorus ferrugineus]
MRFCVLACLWLSYCCFVQCAKLPSAWGRCHKSDAGFSECIRENIEIAVSTLNKPISELNSGALDPLDIPELYIGEGTGPVNVAQHFKNVKLFGISNVKVLNSSVNFKDKYIQSVTVSPQLVLKGDYDLKGQILLLPVYGNGKCTVTLSDVLINHKIVWENIEKKGKVFMKCVDYKITLKPGKVSYQFDNLFDGQKELGDNINKVLNESWEEVFNDVRDGYEKSLGIIFNDLANRILSKVPEKEIFLE